MRNDPVTHTERAAARLLHHLRNPGAPIEDPSPLRHGVDTRELAQVFFDAAAGNLKLALRLLLEDVKRRHPGFKTTPSVRGPGYKEYDRVRYRLAVLAKQAEHTMAPE